MRAPGVPHAPLPFPHSPDHALTVRCRRAGERHTGVRIRVKYLVTCASPPPPLSS